MADATEDDFGKELAAAFDAEETPAEIKPAEPPKADDGTTPPAATPPEPPKPGEEPKKDDKTATPEVPKTGAEATPPADPTKKPEDGTTPPETPTAPGATDQPEAPKPLTKDDITEVIQQIRNDERASSTELTTATQEVLDAYYPDGLSNVLIDQTTGKELKTPQDVVDASGGNMTTEQAAQWLMNEQFKLDQNINKIKEDAKAVAETTVKFKRDSVAVLQRYEPIFKAYPKIQQKVWDQYKKLIKADEKAGVILSAPDMMDFYDVVLEPYRMAYEFATKNPATNPTPPAPGAPATPPAPAPTAADRMDEGGDGGTTAPDDPNDFAQQVSKELARGL